ncbi:MAG: hypothetical protein K5894_08330 [Lachnospiraceae bacterium]|nr:hypothetical protein [Lachnospiraceae bacterium]
MTVSELINQLKRLLVDHDFNAGETRAIKAAIEAAHKSEKDAQWIPTSERNPELIKKLYADGEVTFTYYQSDRVLLQTKSEILIGTYYKDAAVSPHYETDDSYIIASRVIAWRPLPEEYKEHKDDHRDKRHI